MAKKKKQPVVIEYITQGDIDHALDAAFEEMAEAEAELELEASDLEKTSEFDLDEEDDFGLISNDDIENLFKGEMSLDAFPSAAESAVTADTASSDDGGGMIDQSDIDALLSSGMDESAAPASEPSAESAAEEDGGLISQGDIDALLGGGMDDAAAPASEPSAESAAEEDGGLVSQGDIDALLSGGMDDAAAQLAEAATEDSAGDGLGGLISQDDIDSLLKGSEETPPAADAPMPDDASAGDAVSQSDIDALLSGASSESKEDAPAEKVSRESAAGGGDDLISQADIEALLGEKTDDEPPFNETFEPKEPNENGEVVSQSDIDALLMGAMDSEEDSDDFDPSGGGSDGAGINESIISQSGIDDLLEESIAGDVSPEPVILAEATETASSSDKEDTVAWYKKKVYQISAMAALVMIISSAVVFVMLRSRDAGPQPVVLTFPMPSPDAPMTASNEYGTTDIAMPGFVVLAPEDDSGLTCIAADLFLDFSDTTMAAIIKDNEAFVRNVIYGVINNALLSDDKKKVNKIDMALSVREALGTVVPREAIRAVFFDKFELI